MNMFSICKNCGGIYHDREIFKNGCVCPNCGSKNWSDG